MSRRGPFIRKATVFMDRSELYPAVDEAIGEQSRHICESAGCVEATEVVEAMEITLADFHELLRDLVLTDLAGLESLVDGRGINGFGIIEGDEYLVVDHYVPILWQLSDLEESKRVLPIVEWAAMVCLAIGCEGWYKYAVKWRVRVALSARRRNGSGPAGRKWIHAARSVLAHNQVDWNSAYQCLLPLLIELTYVDTPGDGVAVAGNASISPGTLSATECLRLAASGRMSLSHPDLSRFSAKEICEAIETVFGEDS
jgi:hypothetical protein